MKSLSIIFTGLLIVSFHFLGYSQKTLTLEDCITIAQEKSLNIKKAFLSEKESEIAEKYAKQQMLPSLNASSTLSYNIGRRIDPTTNSYLSQSFMSQGINLNSGIMLYNGNRLRNSIKKAMSDRNATEEDTKQMKREIALLVTNTYLSILFAQENLKNMQSQYHSTKEQLSKMKKMIAAGMQPASASLNLEAQLLSDEQKVIESKNNLSMNYLNLKNLLLFDDSEKISISVPNIDLSDLDRADVKTLGELYNSSLKHNPGFSASEYRIKSAILNKKIAKSSFLPSISFGGGLTTNFADRAQVISGFTDEIYYRPLIIDGENKNVGFLTKSPILKNQSYFDQLKNNWGIGFAMQINIPIFNRYSAKAQSQRARLGVESAKISQEQLVQSIKSSIQTAMADSKSAKSQYYASKKTFDAQKAAFENAKKQYEIGVLGSYDFLNAKLMFEQSENRLLIAKYQYIFKSKILDFYLGENLTFE